MPKEIKMPILLAVAAIAVVVAVMVGFKSVAPKAAPHQAFVYTKLSDLVQMEQTNPGNLTADQRKYLNSLPPEVKQRALKTAKGDTSAAKPYQAYTGK